MQLHSSLHLFEHAPCPTKAGLALKARHAGTQARRQAGRQGWQGWRSKPADQQPQRAALPDVGASLIRKGGGEGRDLQGRDRYLGIWRMIYLLS